MSLTADPLAVFPVLSSLSPSARIEFVLAQFPDDPQLEEILVAQGATLEYAHELIAWSQSSADGRRRPMPRRHGVISRGGLSTETKRYLRTLHPPQPVDLAHVRALAARRHARLRTQRQSHGGFHAARAICGGSDDDGSSDDGDGSSVDPPATPRLTPPAEPHLVPFDTERLPSDWNSILQSIRRHVARKDREQAEDTAHEAALRVLEREAGGELFAYPKAAARAEADAILHRAWRTAATTERDATETAAILRPSRGKHVRGVAPKNDDGLTRSTKVRLPHDGRGRGSGRFADDACAECSLWTWRDGKRARRKGYIRPEYPRWVWQGGALVMQWSCPACRPQRAAALIRYPGETLLLIGEATQQLYDRLWKACRLFYGPRWTLAPDEAFANGLGTLPADHPSPWSPPPPELYPTVPRAYSRPKGRRVTMIADRTPHGVSLDRWARPEFSVTDADLAREAKALRAARRQRPIAPIVIEGRVPTGAPLMCEACRESKPFLLSCAHTLRSKPVSLDVKEARPAPLTAGAP